MPAELVANSVIFVAPPGKPGFVEVYVVDSTGTAARRVIDEARVQNMIDAAVSGASGGLVVVDNIAARDALAPEGAMEVLVVDAAADPTVSTGWARYVWMASNSTWLKLAEGES